jgi:hypothetical protein
MEIALGGRPDDSAKMVCSRECIAYLCPSPSKGNAIPSGQIVSKTRPKPGIGERYRTQQ